MVGWHHRLNRHEFEQAPGVGDGQGSPHAAVHGLTESDMTKQLNNKRVSYAPSLSIPLKSNHYTDANHYFCLFLSFIYMDITYRIFSFVSVCLLSIMSQRFTHFIVFGTFSLLSTYLHCCFMKKQNLLICFTDGIY